MTWLPTVMIPAELTSRSTSTQLVAARAPGNGPDGGGPAGRAPARRSLARSTSDMREGTVLTRHPPMLTCTVVVSIHRLTVCPARAVPSQNCCPGVWPRVGIRWLRRRSRPDVRTASPTRPDPALWLSLSRAVAATWCLGGHFTTFCNVRMPRSRADSMPRE
jgi:hypothetical protein